MSDPKMEELILAVEQWLNYRESLKTAKNLQSSGMVVPFTRMSEFGQTMNAASRRVMHALDRSGNDEWLEALGELCLSAVNNIRRQREDKTFLW